MLDRVRVLGLRLKTLAATAAFFLACGVSGAQTAPSLIPYTVKLIAGGGTATYAAGTKCPSGFTSTDAYGDGCLATEIQIGNTATGGKTPGSRSAVADANGNVFFTDYSAGLVRRVDAVTGIVTAVAGGVSASPQQGAACTSGSAITSTDARGDGCLGTQVHLTNPAGIGIAPNGDLYFTDTGQYDVRKIAATNGLVPATGGVISNVAGYAAGAAAYGYAASNATTTVNAATASYLDAPYSVAFDALGDVFIAEEFKDAVLAINTNASGSNTVNGVAVGAGTIWKIAGTPSSAGPYCPNYPASTNGCYGNPYAEGAQANSTFLRNPYSAAVDSNGNVYVTQEYYNSVAKISSSGVLTTYAGIQSSPSKTLTRGPSTSIGIGSIFGVATDPGNDLYITDASSGVIWRVDAGTQAMYVVAGGAKSVCANATDTYGDGCPATQATFGASASPTSNFASTSLPGPGIFGINTDAAGNLYVGDTETNLVREVSTNTQFGQVGNALTQTLDIHFAAGDTPAANAYALTQTSTNFTLGTASCTLNSDNTTDCLLPVTASVATSGNLGAFSATLTVTSTQGGKNVFTLTGTHVQTPVTRTTVGVVANTTCTGTTTYSTGTALTITATITSTGSPAGTVQFYANSAPIGTPVAVSGGSAQLKWTFSTPNSYTITATYSGDTYFNGSSTAAGATITISNPTFSATIAEAPANGTVVQGQTAAYSFTLAQSVYSGTLTFSVSGLPANSSASFSPTTLSATGCSTSNTVTMTITTQLASQKQAGFGGNGHWQMIAMLAAVAMAAMLAVRRRKLRSGWSNVALLLALLVAGAGLVACGKSGQTGVSTPTGTYPLAVKITGSDGTTATTPVSLTVAAYTDPYH